MITQPEIISFDFNFIRILLAFGMLSIATFLDVKKREVHDILWICFGAIALILILLEVNNENALFKVGLSSIVVPVVYVIWRLGFFGGADALAVMVLSVLAPFASVSEGLLTPFTTLTNAGILSLVVLFANACHNMNAILKNEDIFKGFDESKSRKIIAFFIGTRSKNPRYSFSIQRVVGNKKKLDFSLNHAEKDEFCKTPFTWVTPGMPFILYLTAGFVIQVFFGDLLFTSLKLLSIN